MIFKTSRNKSRLIRGGFSRNSRRRNKRNEPYRQQFRQIDFNTQDRRRNEKQIVPSAVFLLLKRSSCRKTILRQGAGRIRQNVHKIQAGGAAAWRLQEYDIPREEYFMTVEPSPPTLRPTRRPARPLVRTRLFGTVKTGRRRFIRQVKKRPATLIRRRYTATLRSAACRQRSRRRLFKAITIRTTVELRRKPSNDRK